MNEDITEFSGENRWLSNFWPCKVMFADVEYPSVEHAYQAAKTLDLEARKAFTQCNAAEAKRLGRTMTIRKDWEATKMRVMETLLEQKFQKGTELANKLIATGNVQLIEGNYWNDRFWGVCRGVGRNNLGKMLMAIRNNLRH